MAEGRTITIVQSGKKCPKQELTVTPCIGTNTDVSTKSSTELWFGFMVNEPVECTDIYIQGDFNFKVLEHGQYKDRGPFAYGGTIHVGETSCHSTKQSMSGCSTLDSALYDNWCACTPNNYSFTPRGMTMENDYYKLTISSSLKVAFGQAPDHPVTYPNFEFDDSPI